MQEICLNLIVLTLKEKQLNDIKQNWHCRIETVNTYSHKYNDLFLEHINKSYYIFHYLFYTFW